MRVVTNDDLVDNLLSEKSTFKDSDYKRISDGFRTSCLKSVT